MSANDLMLDVSQAAELKLAFRRTGWNNAEIKTLSEGDILADVLKVIRGQAKIKMNESSGHLIDCDAAPFIPSGNFNWSVEEHKKGGLFKFDPAKINYEYKSPFDIPVAAKNTSLPETKSSVVNI